MLGADSPRESIEYWQVHLPFDGVKKVTFSSTDFEEIVTEIYKLEDNEIPDADELEKVRRELRDEEFNPDKMGMLVFHPQYTAAALKDKPKLKDVRQIAIFDLRNDSPQIWAVHVVWVDERKANDYDF